MSSLHDESSITLNLIQAKSCKACLPDITHNNNPATHNHNHNHNLQLTARANLFNHHIIRPLSTNHPRPLPQPSQATIFAKHTQPLKLKIHFVPAEDRDILPLLGLMSKPHQKSSSSFFTTSSCSSTSALVAGRSSVWEAAPLSHIGLALFVRRWTCAASEKNRAVYKGILNI
jgi:hypothetical protein